MKQQRIYWLFNDGSSCYIFGKPFQSTPIAWKFERNHDWNFDMKNSPKNYFS